MAQVLGGFQSFTNVLQAPGVAGDFCSTNPRAVALSSQVYGNTGFVAGTGGLTIGLFAWLDTSTYRIATNAGAGAPNCFVGRDRTGLITTYLTSYGMTIPAGFPAGNLFASGDFWVVNNGSSLAVPGNKAYANNTTGVATFAATGSPTTGGTSTASTIAAGTNGATGTIVDNLFTAVSGLSGTLVAGTVLSGTGVASGTTITGQVSGTTGGLGVYTVTPREQTVASTAITGTYGLLTVGGTVVSGFAVGQTVTGTGVTTGTQITQLGTGTGGAGTYYVNLTQTVGSEAINTTTNTETIWYCSSFAAAGELAKITTRVTY